MKLYRLTKISSTNANRANFSPGDSLVGSFDVAPAVGQSFHFRHQHGTNVRLLTTVKAVEELKSIPPARLITTQNSVWKLEDIS